MNTLCGTQCGDTQCVCNTMWTVSNSSGLHHTHSVRCTRGSRNSYKLGCEIPRPPTHTPRLQEGWQRQGGVCTAATCATTAGGPSRRSGQGPTPALKAAGSCGDSRGSGPCWHAGTQGVKQGPGQSACQTRACAVCTASVLWVSAAAAAAAGGSVPPGQRRLQRPGPRSAAAGADTRCGTRRSVGRPGGVGEAPSATRCGGSPGAGRGGGEPRRSSAPRVPAREEEREPAGKTALLVAPAAGRRPALLSLCPRPRPRTGRCPRCPQRGLSGAGRGGRAGPAAPGAGGAGDGGGDGGRLDDPAWGQ
jgi:hypothetical protein